MVCFCGWSYGARYDEVKLNSWESSSQLKQNTITNVNANTQADNYTIDPISNLRDHAVYIWGGYGDYVILPKAQTAMRDVYQHYGVSNSKLTFTQEAATHISWDKTKVQTGIKKIYSDLGYASSTSDFGDNRSNFEAYGNWIAFGQKEFVGGPVSRYNFD